MNNGSAIILDTTEDFDGIQDPSHVEMFLVKELGEDASPLYYKYESTNPLQTDMRHSPDDPWVEQTTACPDIISADDEYGSLLVTEGGRQVNVDDGFILDFWGRPMRVVAIESNGDIIDEAQARAREQTSGRRLSRFTEWGFRLVRVTKTNGPEERFQLQETEKIRRDRAEGQMADRIGEAFTAAIERMGNLVPGESPKTKSGPESADDLIKLFENFANDPVRATAMKEQLLAELEGKTTNEG